MVRVALGDTPASRIGDLALDVLIQLVADRIWGRVFAIEPFYLVKQQTAVAVTAPGYLDVSTLTERFYRLQAVRRDAQTYHALDARYLSFNDDGTLAASDASSSAKYFWRGSQLHLLPYDTAVIDIIEYSYRPARYTTLAETATVVWPDGQEDALVLAAAARANRADKELAIEAAQAELELLATVSRRDVGPIVPFQLSQPQEVGGE